ncbi:MAG: fatty acyl-AMP ligase [Synechococcales bacterium]|nr:fatty acyl-AMP ligase [Synechococcales bacterium]
MVDLLGDRAQQQPDQTAFTFLRNGEDPAPPLTYGRLDRRARAIATSLQTVLAPGERAVLVYPYEAGLEFIAAFLGCLYAGVVAVPSHPPRNRYGFADLAARLAAAETTTLLTPASLRAKLQRQFAEVDAAANHRWIIPEQIPEAIAPDWQRPDLREDNLAFLQFTSGSTGQPKGVMVTHQGLLHNQRVLQQAFGHTDQSIGVGWLPLFHDMGLIGNVLQALYLGTACVLMSPIDFIQKPVRWLQAISRYRATTSGGPNFAYDLLCRYVTEAQKQTLDLSTWSLAFSGAEPVRAETLETFATQFAACGFRREAFYPCYGMAEAILFITGGTKAIAPTVIQVDEAALGENRVMVSARSPRCRTLVSCGYPWLESAIAIVNPDTQHRCPPQQVGEIWVAGPGLGRGYWHQPQETEQTFQAFLADTGDGPFLRTGDLGFIHDGELYITGRLRDVLVFWGFNHYPERIEATVQRCHPAFPVDRGAAFAIPVNGQDRLVVVQEVERRDRHRITAADVVEAIRWAVFDEHFVDVYAIALLKPGALPKTPSGKVQRRLCRDKFLDGSLEVIDQWRSPPHSISDIPAMVRRYLNPVVHLRRYGATVRRRLNQWLRRA